MSESTVEIQPDYARLVEALRDTGYSLNTAIADIIDNSIAADATKIDVSLDLDENYDVHVAIVDNGCGMDREGIVNGLRLGSLQRVTPDSLGKFGMGLKTASTSFCRRLAVVSRATQGGDALQGIYDLDTVHETGRLTATIGEPTLEQIELLKMTAGSGSGTLIEWLKIDRILENYDNPAGAHRARALAKAIESLVDHLSLVFQRYLDANDPRVSHHTKISVNGKDVVPFDPFCEDVLPPIDVNEVVDVEIEQENGEFEKAELRIRLFRIPNDSEWPSEQRSKLARVFNDNQGVYVYRENRLIHGPDWLGEFRKEPHYVLARVELSFDHRLDDAFKVDIKKSKIELAPALKSELKKYFNQVRTAAQNERRGAETKRALEGGKGLHGPADRTIENNAGSLKTANIGNVNPDGSAEITNNRGTASQRIRIVVGPDNQAMRIEPVESLPDGVLWMPSVIDGHPAVSLNCSHEFYGKVYEANKDRQNVIQALDFVLWSLAQAELNNLDESNRILFEDFRIETSRNLRRLTETLPDPTPFVESDLDDTEE
jgi:hypothetical protein